VRTQINCNKDWLKTPEQHTQNAVIIGIWRLRVCAWAERGAEKESGESAAAKEKEINLVAKANGEKFRNKFQLGLSEWVSFADGKVKSGGNIIVLCASSVTCAGAKLAEAKITKTPKTQFKILPRVCVSRKVIFEWRDKHTDTHTCALPWPCVCVSASEHLCSFVKVLRKFYQLKRRLSKGKVRRFREQVSVETSGKNALTPTQHLILCWYYVCVWVRVCACVLIGKTSFYIIGVLFRSVIHWLILYFVLKIVACAPTKIPPPPSRTENTALWGTRR